MKSDVKAKKKRTTKAAAPAVQLNGRVERHVALQDRATGRIVQVIMSKGGAALVTSNAVTRVVAVRVEVLHEVRRGGA